MTSAIVFLAVKSVSLEQVDALSAFLKNFQADAFYFFSWVVISQRLNDIFIQFDPKSSFRKFLRFLQNVLNERKGWMDGSDY